VNWQEFYIESQVVEAATLPEECRDKYVMTLEQKNSYGTYTEIWNERDTGFDPEEAIAYIEKGENFSKIRVNVDQDRFEKDLQLAYGSDADSVSVDYRVSYKSIKGDKFANLDGDFTITFNGIVPETPVVNECASVTLAKKTEARDLKIAFAAEWTDTTMDQMLDVAIFDALIVEQSDATV
jgi:hypothetical protein